MDPYSSRGNTSKFQANKNQKIFRSTVHGRSVSFLGILINSMTLLNDIFLINFQTDDEMKSSERERSDDYYLKKGKNYSDYSMTKYQQQTHGNKSAADNKTRYDRGGVGGGGGYQPSRQGSETRSNHDSEMNRNHRDINRSQDPSSSHFKPPIAQAALQRPYNFASLQRLPLNIDNLPPRLKKKHLHENGLPEELADKNISELLQSYSNHNTMSMGRNNRNNRFDHQQNFSSNYHKYGNQQQNFDGNHNQRSITPPPSKIVSSRQTATPPNKFPTQSSSSSRYDTIQRREETSSLSITKSVQDDGSGSFDWSEDVMNSQSLPYEVNANHPSKYDDNNRPRNRRRNRR